ncbi:DUF3310 domain-containing protein [Streptomyces sp. NPDC001822]|uniref:DUF3310 domain-containing protein n=1 Tax=Streptomyces sp. NPDC001822 TaxID=3364614 RepID=UPI003697039E
MTYEVGDEVIIATPSTPYVQMFKGMQGTVTRVVSDYPFPFEVRVDNRLLCFAGRELAPVDLADISDFRKVLDEVHATLWAEVLEPVEDEVNSPSHYTWLPGGIEVIDITELLNFNVGNVVKYALRAGHKTEDPITDLRKAAWYINREIERLEAGK